MMRTSDFFLTVSAVFFYFISVESRTVDVKCEHFYFTNNRCLMKSYQDNTDISKTDEINIRDPEGIAFSEVHGIEMSCQTSISLTELPTHFFVIFPNLEALEIQCKNISKIPQSDFEHANKLKKLKVMTNEVKKLESNTFSKATNLEEIFLTWNKIHTIEDYAFNGLDRLKVLNLGGNRLKNIGKFAFANLPSLAYLDLSGNGMEEIEVGAFDLPKLETLYLSFNKLHILPDTLFTQAPLLTELVLRNSQIQRINNALYSLPSLQNLELSLNKMEDFDIKKIAKLSNLIDLDLANTDFNLDAVNVLAADIKSANSSLEKLSLVGNKKLGEIIFEKLKLFPNLKEVNLQFNSLKKMDLEAVRTGGLTKLRIIDIAGNDFDGDWLKTKTTELTMNLDSSGGLQITLN